MNKITIRRANKADIPFIKDCLIDSWIEHAKNAPNLLDEERMRKSDVESYYNSAIESDNSIVLIAELLNSPVGLMRADIKDIDSFFKHNKILFLDDIYVTKKYRGQGIAKSLFSEMEKFAKKNKIKRLQGRVFEFNSPIKKLLLSLGYNSPHATWDKLLE